VSPDLILNYDDWDCSTRGSLYRAAGAGRSLGRA